MKLNFRTVFFLIGMIAVVIMLLSLNITWSELLHYVQRAGVWLPGCIALWLPIYMMNACAWYAIINDGTTTTVGFLRVLKYTISGYALNNVTPVGVLGGEPYRIMELTPYVGGTKATSSVLLYSMMHIFSHFLFWSFSIVLYLILYGTTITLPVGILLMLCALFCYVGLYVFICGYRNGFVQRALRFFAHVPLIGNRVCRFASSHAEALARVDEQIATLHSQHRTTFFCSLSLEFFARMLGCVEILFILHIFTTEVSYWDCVLMQAFMSLFANLLFFIPMQIGTREGGFAIVTDVLRMGGAYGILTSLVTRLRELFWIIVGLLLVKVGNKRPS